MKVIIIFCIALTLSIFSFQSSYADICNKYHGEALDNCVSGSLRSVICTKGDCKNNISAVTKSAAMYDKTGKSQFHLGLIYEHGWNVAPNFREAIKWYKEAINNSSTPEIRGVALLKLGEIYERQTNFVAAFQCYKQAATMGIPGAQFELAKLYFLGRGTVQDEVQAYAWSSVAASQGVGNSDLQMQVEYIRNESGNALLAQSSFAEGKELAAKYYNEYTQPLKNS